MAWKFWEIARPIVYGTVKADEPEDKYRRLEVPKSSPDHKKDRSRKIVVNVMPDPGQMSILLL